MAFGKDRRKCQGIELARAKTYSRNGRFSQLYQIDRIDLAFLHDHQVALPKLDPTSRGVSST